MAARKNEELATRSFQPAAAGDVEEIEVRRNDPGPDDDDDDESPGTAPRTDGEPGGGTRQENKRRRYDGRLRDAEERARRAEEETTSLRARLDAMEQHDRGRENVPNLDTSYKNYLDGLLKQETDLHERYQLRSQAGNLTKSEIEEFRKQAADIDERKAEARHRYYQTKVAPPQAENDAVRILRLEYPDIVDNPQRWAYANAEFAKRIARGEKDGGLPMYRKIIEDVRVELGIGPRPVDEATKDRHRSRGVGAGAGGTETVTVRMTPGAKSIAEGRYPDLPPQQAWKKWAENEGRRAALRKQ